MNPNCRDAGDNSYHVSVALDADKTEAENLTHRESIEIDELGDKDQTELSFVCEPNPEKPGLLLTHAKIEGDLFYFHITKETALQLADMFKKVAATV